MLKRIFLLGAFNMLFLLSFGQDMAYTRKLIEDLSSERFCGRGYVNRGDSIAARYLSSEMKRLKLKGFTSNYYQSYTTPMNTYPENPTVFVGDRELSCSEDFIVYPNSPSCEGTFDLVWMDKKVMTNASSLRSFLKKDLSNSFVAIDSNGLGNKELYGFAKNLINSNVFKARGVVSRAEKLKFSAKPYVKDYPTLIVQQSQLDTADKKIKVSIKNKFIKKYNTQNLAGYIPGKTDTCLVFCAHYDHLGYLGDNMYPGANDNASGVAMVLNLAKYYKKKHRKPHYTLVFLLFSCEESGLLGSKYYVENPFVPLQKTKMVMNFDMVATGTHGIYIFNAKAYPQELEMFENINEKNSYVSTLRGTRPVSSSDHASFYDEGVKAVFFYTAGGNGDYHEVTDTYDRLNFPQFEGMFKLVRDFTDELK